MKVTGRLFIPHEVGISFTGVERMLAKANKGLKLSDEMVYLTFRGDWDDVENHFFDSTDYVAGYLTDLEALGPSAAVFANVRLYETPAAYVLKHLMDVTNMAMLPVVRILEHDDDNRVSDARLLRLEPTRLENAPHAGKLNPLYAHFSEEAA